MFSLQRLLSRDDKFFDLMEGSAEEARASIRSLIELLRAPDNQQSLEPFGAARRKEKHLAQELTEQLCRTFVTPIEREDIEALSHALYKIPKAAEKFGERYVLSGSRKGAVDFARHIELLEAAAEVIVAMVREIRRGVELETVRKEHARLQQIEGDGDKLMLVSLEKLYANATDPFQVMLAKDLLELIEKVFDRCRDVGNIVFHIILKYS